MSRWSRLRASASGSLPTVVVLIVVVAVGARLLYLSVQHHAAVARATAVAVGAEVAAKMEPPLRALAALATRQAESSPGGRRDPPLQSAGEPPTGTQHTFSMAADDTVLRAAAAESDLANGIAGEWQSAEAARPLPGAAILGPMRIGSHWIVAARAPYATTAASGGPGSAGWSVAYSDLDDLIADSHLARLTPMGYDFQLSQILPRGAPPRIFVGSSTEPLLDAVGTPVHLPMESVPGTHLELVIRPRAGWYPASLLAADVCLIAFMAWLLAFGTHDLSHALQRSREALATARRRLRAVNQQLAAEIQQRMNLQETFSHALFHDAFTGLPNRRYFMDRLDRALREVRSKQRPRIGVIIVDITRFKLVNDLLGHTAGDELMVQAARRFEKSAAGSEGVLARWGGDQFALLILKLESTTEALGIGARLREELRFPFQLRRHQLVVAASVGVTCTDSGQQLAEDVVREADIALSVAKQSEGSKIVLYAPNMSSQAATLVSLEADLHIALEKHQLQVLLQPVVDLRTHRMVGAEALLRWLHPVESVLAPDRFLRIAEEAGLMVPITRWVILRVLKIAADWRSRVPAGQTFYISINLSPSALRDPGLAEYVGTLLRETGTPAEYLKFEVTEAALINNVGAARETLEQLHALGIGLMLDDFGTGFTSLSNLQLFPFDFVKIERPFVNLNNADQANTGMMAAMVQMAASLKLTAIAEIIESEAAATALQEMGCEFGQGYYFSGPVSAEEALHRLSSQEPFKPREGANPLDAPTLAAPLADSSPTLMFAPLDDRSPTLMVPPLEDASATQMFAPLEDPADGGVTPPPDDPASTLIVPPLEEPTAAGAPSPHEDTASTLIVPPLEEPSTAGTAPPLEDTASTVIVPPLEEIDEPQPPDSSPTAIMPPFVADSSLTVEVPAHWNPPPRNPAPPPKIRDIKRHVPPREDEPASPRTTAGQARRGRGTDEGQ